MQVCAVAPSSLPPSDLIRKPTTIHNKVAEVFFANLRALLITLITFRADEKNSIRLMDGETISPKSCDTRLFFITLTSEFERVLYFVHFVYTQRSWTAQNRKCVYVVSGVYF